MSFLNTILQYFFQPLPAGSFKYLWLWVAITVFMFIASIVLGFYLRKKSDDKMLRKFFKKVPYHLLVLSLLFGLYLLSRYERIPFLSMRILNYTLLAITIYVVAKNVRTYLHDYPEAKKNHENQVQKNKYLPRKKAKKKNK